MLYFIIILKHENISWGQTLELLYLPFCNFISSLQFVSPLLQFISSFAMYLLPLVLI